jgi:hypothetical protein
LPWLSVTLPRSETRSADDAAETVRIESKSR